MKVNAKTMTGKNVTIEGLTPDASIADLREAAALQLNIPPNSFDLNGIKGRLVDDKLLKDYEIADGATILVGGKMGGGAPDLAYQLTLYTPSMEYSLKCEIGYGETIGGFKEKIAKLTDYPNPQISLDDKPADDNTKFTKLMRDNPQLKLSVEVGQEPNMK